MVKILMHINSSWLQFTAHLTAVSSEELEMTKKMCRAKDILISDLQQDNQSKRKSSY